VDGDMNWKRGFHRIYLVGAIGWVLYVLFWMPIQYHLAYVDGLDREHSACIFELRGVTQQEHEYGEKECDRVREIKLGFENKNWFAEYRFVYIFGWGVGRPVVALLPPVLVYAILAPLIWFIKAGFRKAGPDNRTAAQVTKSDDGNHVNNSLRQNK
jgi:hypothetical protein